MLTIINQLPYLLLSPLYIRVLPDQIRQLQPLNYSFFGLVKNGLVAQNSDVVLARRYVVPAELFVKIYLIEEGPGTVALLYKFASFVAYRLPYPLLVVGVAGHAYISKEVRVLHEDEIVQVGTLQAEGVRLIQRRINELALLLINYVVVQDSLLAALSLNQSIRSLLHRDIGLHVAHDHEADADEAAHNKIQLINFLRLFNNNHIFINTLKAPWQQSLSYVVEH